MDDTEKEVRDRLIDAARTDVAFLAERRTEFTDALDRLNRQAYRPGRPADLSSRTRPAAVRCGG